MFNIPNIIKIFKGDDADAMDGDRLLIVDADNIFEGNLESLKNMNLNYDIQIDEKLVKNVETRNSDNNSGITEVDNSKEEKIFEKIKEKIQNDEIDKAILIEDKEGIINIQYIVKNLSMESEVPQDIVNAITILYRNIQIAKLGLTQEQLQTLSL